MTGRRVVVTDYTFPDLDRERLAATQAGASFEAHQCRSAEDVAQAIRGADLAVVQFAPANPAASPSVRRSWGTVGTPGTVSWGKNVSLRAKVST